MFVGVRTCVRVMMMARCDACPQRLHVAMEGRRSTNVAAHASSHPAPTTPGIVIEDSDWASPFQDGAAPMCAGTPGAVEVPANIRHPAYGHDVYADRVACKALCQQHANDGANSCRWIVYARSIGRLEAALFGVPALPGYCKLYSACPNPAVEELAIDRIWLEHYVRYVVRDMLDGQPSPRTAVTTTTTTNPNNPTPASPPKNHTATAVLQARVPATVHACSSKCAVSLPRR